jgi:hypothetical protein
MNTCVSDCADRCVKALRTCYAFGLLGATVQKLIGSCLCRSLAEAYDLLLIRAGAKLLTPFERFLYAVSVCAILVLVSIGFAKAYSFYAARLHEFLQRNR